MNQKLKKIYKHKSERVNSDHVKYKLKQLAKVAPSMFLLGALPTSSQAQVLSDAGLICNPNLGQASCDLPTGLDMQNGIINAASTSFGTTIGTTGGGTLPINIVQSFGISSAGIDMDCDGEDEFNLWNGGLIRKWGTAGGTQIANFVGNYGVDFTNLSSGAAFGFDVTYNSPGGVIYGNIQVEDCANSAFVSASDDFQGGANVFDRLNSAYAGTLQGSDLIFNDNGPINVDGSGFVPVQFDNNGNTHYGWVEVAIDFPRLASVVNTGYALTPDAPASAACDACDVATIPTASEWGLITLGLLLLSFGTTMIIRKEGALATDQGNLSLDFNKPLFNTGLFKKSLMVALGLGLMLSVGSVILTGTLTLTDIIGGAIATPILAYWLHLIGMYKNDEI
jgi:hypothetical protein